MVNVKAMSAQGIFYNCVNAPSFFDMIYSHYRSDQVLSTKIELRKYLKIDSYGFLQHLRFIFYLYVFCFLNKKYFFTTESMWLSALNSENYPRTETLNKAVYDLWNCVAVACSKEIV